MKCTPGPWKIRKAPMPVDGEYDYAIVASEKLLIAEVFGRVSKDVRPDAYANAILMSKALELVEALPSPDFLNGIAKWFSNNFPDDSLSQETQKILHMYEEKIRDVLASIEGETE